MPEQDYKLLVYLQSQPHKRLNKYAVLTYSSSVPATRARIDELKEKGYIQESLYYIRLLPPGEKAIEDYQIEQQRQQKEQESPYKPLKEKTSLNSFFSKDNIMFASAIIGTICAIITTVNSCHP